MATSKMSLKLLIDTKSQKVLFAEAQKDFVEYLFTVQALPLGTVTSLLETHTHSMGGCLGDLYKSMQNLCPNYIQEGKVTNSVLKPTFNTSGTPLVLPNNLGTSHVAADIAIVYCPKCAHSFQRNHVSLAPPLYITQNTGLVKGGVTYLVMDNLEVTPSPTSTISSIWLLNKFNIQELSALEERFVDLPITEEMNLLKTSLRTKAVLISIFLGKEA